MDRVIRTSLPLVTIGQRNTASESGPAQAVAFSANVLPVGVSVTFTPASLPGSGMSTMKLSISRKATSGTYLVRATGTGSSGARTAMYTLTIR